MNSNNQIGDMLSTLPMYALLKDKFTGAKITFVAASTNYPIPFLDINPYIDKVLIYDKSTLGSTINFYQKLRAVKYQIGIVQSTIKLSGTSHIINFLSGAKLRVGVDSIDNKKNKDSYFLNVKKNFNWVEEKVHQSERSFQLAAQLFDDKPENKFSAGKKISFNKEDECFVQEFLEPLRKSEAKIIGIHPGAGKTENIWDADNFVMLIDMLNKEKKISVVITCGTMDEMIVNKITEELKKLNIPFLIAKDFNLKQLAALLDQVDLFITNDTGPMHIAGASEVKQISLFGPTQSWEWGPTGKNKINIQSKSKNINDISVDQVLKSIS